VAADRCRRGGAVVRLDKRLILELGEALREETADAIDASRCTPGRRKSE
jgi:hypothetical protein